MLQIIIKSNTYEGPAVIFPSSLEDSIGSTESIVVGGWYSIYRSKVGYSVTVGKKYIAFGVLQVNGETLFLIQNDNNDIIFLPSELAEIMENTLPIGWRISDYWNKKIKVLVIGFDYLTESYSNIICMINGDKKATEEFLKYKDWVENWL